MFSRGFLSASSGRLFGMPGGSRRGPADLADFRRLAAQLNHDLPRGETSRSALLVTPGVSDLPAYSGVSLAQCLADEMRKPILLVDACCNASDLTRLAGMEAAPGLAEFLADPHASLDALALPTQHPDVWLMPAGNRKDVVRSNGAARMTDSAGIAALLEGAASRFDFVVLAGGSVLHDPLALGMAPHAGCVLLMAIENQTRLEDLDLAQQSLAFCRPRKIGLLLTLPAGPRAKAT